VVDNSRTPSGDLFRVFSAEEGQNEEEEEEGIFDSDAEERDFVRSELSATRIRIFFVATDNPHLEYEDPSSGLFTDFPIIQEDANRMSGQPEWEEAWEQLENIHQDLINGSITWRTIYDSREEIDNLCIQLGVQHIQVVTSF
jgi:hypothetical protein